MWQLTNNLAIIGFLQMGSFSLLYSLHLLRRMMQLVRNNRRKDVFGVVKCLSYWRDWSPFLEDLWNLNAFDGVTRDVRVQFGFSKTGISHHTASFSLVIGFLLHKISYPETTNIDVCLNKQKRFSQSNTWRNNGSVLQFDKLYLIFFPPMVV